MSCTHHEQDRTDLSYRGITEFRALSRVKYCALDYSSDRGSFIFREYAWAAYNRLMFEPIVHCTPAMGLLPSCNSQ
jgi:hypothetical protein